MKARPILFSGDMVRAILNGKKSQTRRVVKPQPDSLYRLTADRIGCILSDEGVAFYGNKRDTTESNSKCAEHRLCGGIGRTSILQDAIQGLWSQGVRGVVSATRAQERKGLSDGISLPQQPEADGHDSPADLRGMARRTPNSHAPGTSPRWQAREQSAREPLVGNSRGELARPEGARAGQRGREASDGEADRCGVSVLEVGNRQGIVQPKARGAHSWTVPGWRLSHCPYEVGLRLWVRETFTGWIAELRESVEYRADGYSYRNRVLWTPSIHMPRKASRITLEVTEVRVQRVQEISEADAKAEGVEFCLLHPPVHGNPRIAELANEYLKYETSGYTCEFSRLWDSINDKRGYSWKSNPWVWIVNFRRVP